MTTVSGSNTALLSDNPQMIPVPGTSNSFSSAPSGTAALTLTGPTYTISATNVSGIGLFGTGSDTAIMTAPPVESNLVATPTATSMACGGVLGDPNTLGLGYESVAGYGTVLANATNFSAQSPDTDDATFYGPTSGSNTFFGSKPYSYMVGSGYDVQAVNFANVSAYSNSAGDIASLYSPAADTSTFDTTSANNATLTDGSGSYSIVVENFPAVYATSQGTDSATLIGSSTETNEFIASDPYTSLSGVGYVFLTYGFASVTAESSTSLDDTAYFYGVSTHNAFAGSQTESQMIGTDAAGQTTYEYQAMNFESVLASSMSAGDLATIEGEGAGDQFIAGPITNYPVSAALIGAADAFTIQVFAFQQITATSAGKGGDYVAPEQPTGSRQPHQPRQRRLAHHFAGDVHRDWFRQRCSHR